MMQELKHYSAEEIISYNAIMNFINTNRNFGKTWSFQKRAFIRASKRHKMAIWLRRFNGERDEAADKLFASRDLQKYCGISVYDKKENPAGNFYRQGKHFYCKDDAGRWINFMTVYSLSDRLKLRSADNVDIDTIVFDEYTTTPDKYRRYRGNEVNDLMDIFISLKREHQVRLFLLGNKESYSNPYYSYFNIPSIPNSYEGIRTFRNGSIAVEQRNNKPLSQTEYENKLESMLSGTTYGSYYLDAGYKTSYNLKWYKTPPAADLYIQVNIDGNALRICLHQGIFYVSSTLDNQALTYSNILTGRYKNEKVLIRSYKRFLTDYACAVADNRVKYADAPTYEKALQFHKWLMI